MSEFAKVEAVEEPFDDPMERRIRRIEKRVATVLFGIVVLGGLNLLQLGAMGDPNEDHSKIMSAVERTRDRTPNKEDLAKTMDELKQEIQSLRRDLTQAN